MSGRLYWDPLLSAVGVAAAILALHWATNDTASPLSIATFAFIAGGARYWALRTGFDFRAYNREDRRG